MAPSMRTQTRVAKHAKETIESRLKSKTLAVHLLKNKNLSLRKVAETTRLSKSLVGNLKELICKQDWDEIDRQCNELESTKKGKRTVLSCEEEEMIVKRLIFAAKRGFAVDVSGIKRIMMEVANDGRKGWKNAVPSDDAVRAFRARHREITFRNYERKENAKLKGESYEHVQRYFEVLKDIEAKHPGILQDGNRIWNMDETAVDSTFGQKRKVFGPSNTHHGGFVASAKTAGAGKHITCVVAVSASGKKAPPFFIVSGKNVMSNWVEPLPSIYKNSGEICRKFEQENWFPKDGVIKCTEKGSMEMSIMPAFIKHLNAYVRSFLPNDVSYLLSLDGHGSRNGVEWLELCSENRCEVVVSPANTSHFLQPCDQFVNKTFKMEMRTIRDEFAKSGILDTRSVRFNLVCGVHAYNTITVRDATASFARAGIFPFSPEFPEQFKSVSTTSDSSSTQRVCDGRTVAALRDVILSNGYGHSRKLQKINEILRKAETVQNILLRCATRSPVLSAASDNKKKNVALDCGAPAEWLTMGQSLKKRKEREEEKLAEQQTKVRKKREAAEARRIKAQEKEAKRLERELARANRKQEREVLMARKLEAREKPQGLGRALAKSRGADVV